MHKQFEEHRVRLQEARPDLVADRGGRMSLGGLLEEILCGKKPAVKRDRMFLTATSGVDHKELESISAGIKKLLDDVKSRLVFTNFGSAIFGRGPFESADWYQERALMDRNRGAGLQVDVYKVDKLLRDEPFQVTTPHFDVMVLNRDLTAAKKEPKNNFVYGLNSYPNDIISTKRLSQRFSERSLALQSLAVIAAHEVGHNFGLVNRNFNIGRGAYRGAHCNGKSGPCLMEQVDVPGCKTIAEQTRLLIDKLSWLCSDCLDEAKFKRERLERHGVIW